MLATVHTITRFIGVCPEHKFWATPSSLNREQVEEWVREHNEAEHQGVESRD